MFPEWFQNLPWDIFETLINFAELIVICVPAIAAFMYYAMQSVDIWKLDATDNGATLLVHNKANKSVFITDIHFVVPENSVFEKPVVTWNDSVKQLKPDDYIEVVINYKMTTHEKQSFKLIVEYNRTNKKVVKVTV